MSKSTLLSVRSVVSPYTDNRGAEKITIRKRFIAGAVCPHCQQKDTLALWRENHTEVVECVKCGYQMHEKDRQDRNRIHNSEKIINIFHLE